MSGNESISSKMNVLSMIEDGRLIAKSSTLLRSDLESLGLGKEATEFFLMFDSVADESEGFRILSKYLFSPYFFDGYIHFGDQDGMDFLIKKGTDICYILRGGERTPEEGDRYENIWDFVSAEGVV